MKMFRRIWRKLSGPRPIKKVYVASAADDWPQARKMQVCLEHCGFEITHDWTEGIRAGEYNVAAQQPAEDWKQMATIDMQGVREADAVVFVAPGARGSHAELGAALALGLPVIVYARRPDLLTDKLGRDCVFYHHPLVWIEGTVTGVVIGLKARGRNAS